MKASNKNRNLLAWLLLSAMAASALVGCAEKTNDSDAAQTTPALVSDTDVPEEEPDSLEARKKVSDNLPDHNFEGADFRAIVQDSCAYDFWAEESKGDPWEDAIRQRNAKVAERFNVNINEPVIVNYSEISNMVRKTVNSQDDAYDIIFGQMETTGSDAMGGIFLNWYDIPNLDFSRPWYPKSLIENAATVNGRMFSLLSDLCLSYAQQTWAIMYDKVYANNYNLPDLYDMVRSGEWTVDNFRTIVKDIYEDKNSNGKADEDDFYGYVTAGNGCLALAYFYGFNQKLVQITEDNEVEMVLNCEKASDITDKLHELFFNTTGVRNLNGSGNGDLFGMFLKGNTIFAPIQVQYAYSQLRDYENDYGILPFFKWDTNQEQYYSSVDAGSDVMAVPITATQNELIGYMVEALSCESWKSVLPVYYDVVLNVKSIRDEDSVEMLNILLDNREVDFASLYNAWNGWVFELPAFLSSNKGFASTYKSKEKAKIKQYEKMLKPFLEEKT